MFKVLTEGCEPTRGSKYSACVDLYASKDIVIGAGETVVVPLGVKIDLSLIEGDYVEKIYVDDGDGNSIFNGYNRERFYDFKLTHYLQLMLRSSLGAKHGLVMANGVGVIDMDYEGEIGAIIHNPVNNHADITVYKGISGTKYLDVPDKVELDFFDKYTIKKGDRIAQITLLEHKGYLFDIDTEDKRTGGYGSTGK